MVEKDKRYLVLTWDTYYPSGGLGDMDASFDTIPEAIECLNNRKHDHGEIYDRVEGVIIDSELYDGKY